MRQQALYFPKVRVRQSSPGRRYILGKVSLGELNESFWSGIGTWTAEDYKRQWTAAAKLFLDSRIPVLLYTDVGPKSSVAYHVVPTATDLLVFEQIFRGPHRPLTREGAARQLIRLRDRVSCWAAPVASLHSLAVIR